LKRVLLGEAERLSEEGLTAKEEEQRERDRRGHRRTQTGTDEGTMTAEEFRDLVAFLLNPSVAERPVDSGRGR